jgi:hypothetical protein
MNINLIAKKLFAPILYRHKPIGLTAGKLYLYLDALYRTNEVEGAVVEIGCNLCGTSALANQMLYKLGSKRKYVCVDTFGGFVGEQFTADIGRGTPKIKESAFAANDIDLAKKILHMHKADNVQLVQGDIVKLPDSMLPEKISVCLLDVDLYEPIFAGLTKVVPRMSSGGIILVDDCGGDTWKAGDAFRKFVAENSLSAYSVEFGMGIIRF